MIKVKFNRTDLLIKAAISLLLFAGAVYILIDRRSNLVLLDITAVIALLVLFLFSYRGIANETKNLTFTKEYFEFHRLFPLPGKKFKRSGKYRSGEISEIIVKLTHGGGSRHLVKVKLKTGESIKLSLPINHKLFVEPAKTELLKMKYPVRMVI